MKTINKRLLKVIFLMLTVISITICIYIITGLAQKSNNKKVKVKEIKTELLSKPYKNQEFATGTYVETLIYDKGYTDKDFEQIKEKLHDLVSKFEIYEQGHSELDEINAQAGIKPVKVSKETFALVQALSKYAKSSKGQYNPTVGVMTHLWHIGFSDAQVPADNLIQDTLNKVNYNDIILNKKKQTVFLKTKGMMIEANGIAKGFIGKHLLKSLKSKGITTAVVNLGGHAYTIGDNPNRKDGSWEVGIANPELGEKHDSPLVGLLTSKHSSFNTTSYYGRYLKVDNEIYSHLFDTKTGRPIETDVLSATIIGDNPYHDDAYSNVIFNLGAEKALDFINKHDELDAIIITNDKEIYISNHIPGEFKLLDKSFKVIKDTSVGQKSLLKGAKK